MLELQMIFSASGSLLSKVVLQQTLAGGFEIAKVAGKTLDQNLRTLMKKKTSKFDKVTNFTKQRFEPLSFCSTLHYIELNYRPQIHKHCAN